MDSLTWGEVFAYGGAGLCLASYVWLTALAFRHGTAWGIVLVLFFPIAGLVYALDYKAEKKGPIVVYCFGLSVGLVSMTYIGF
jgi:hypothetical protein